MRRRPDEDIDENDELSQVTITFHKDVPEGQPYTLTITDLPAEVFKRMLTATSLQNSEGENELKAKMVVDPRGPYPDKYESETRYYEASHRTVKTLEAMLSAAFAGQGYTPKADTDTRVSDAERAFRRQQIDKKFAERGTPLPDYPHIHLIAEARFHTRLMIRFLGHTARHLTGLLKNNPHISESSCIQWLRQIAAHANLAADALEKIQYLPPSDVEIVVKNTYPEPWEGL